MRMNVSHERFSPRFFLVIVHTLSLTLFPIRMRKLKGSSVSRSSKLTVPANAARSSKSSYRFICQVYGWFFLLHIQKNEIRAKQETLVVDRFRPKLKATASSFDSNMKDDLTINVFFALIDLFCLRNLMNIYTEMAQSQCCSGIFKPDYA